MTGGWGAPPPPARSGPAAAEAAPVPRGVRGRAGRGLESFAAFLGCFPPRCCRLPRAQGRGDGAGGVGVPRDAAAAPPRPTRTPLPPPPPVFPLDRAGGGLIRLTTFWEEVGGAVLGVCGGRQSATIPREVPAHGGPGPTPEAGNERRERGAASASSFCPTVCRGWQSPQPRQGPGWGPSATPAVPGPVGVSGTGATVHWHSTQGKGVASARAVSGLGPWPPLMSLLGEPSCARGAGSHWGAGGSL